MRLNRGSRNLQEVSVPVLTLVQLFVRGKKSHISPQLIVEWYLLAAMHLKGYFRLMRVTDETNDRGQKALCMPARFWVRQLQINS